MPPAEQPVVPTTKVAQIINISPQATKDQMVSLFGVLGKIEDLRLYPTVRNVSVPVSICFVKYFDPVSVGVAQHMTYTMFIDRVLIVTPYVSVTDEIPDELQALEIAAQNIIPGLQCDTFLPVTGPTDRFQSRKMGVLKCVNDVQGLKVASIGPVIGSRTVDQIKGRSRVNSRRRSRSRGRSRSRSRGRRSRERSRSRSRRGSRSRAPVVKTSGRGWSKSSSQGLSRGDVGGTMKHVTEKEKSDARFTGYSAPEAGSSYLEKGSLSRKRCRNRSRSRGGRSRSRSRGGRSRSRSRVLSQDKVGSTMKHAMEKEKSATRFTGCSTPKESSSRKRCRDRSRSRGRRSRSRSRGRRSRSRSRGRRSRSRSRVGKSRSRSRSNSWGLSQDNVVNTMKPAKGKKSVTRFTGCSAPKNGSSSPEKKPSSRKRCRDRSRSRGGRSRSRSRGRRSRSRSRGEKFRSRSRSNSLGLSRDSVGSTMKPAMEKENPVTSSTGFSVPKDGSKSLKNPSSSKKRCRSRSRSREGRSRSRSRGRRSRSKSRGGKSRSRSRSNSQGQSWDHSRSTINPAGEKKKSATSSTCCSEPKDGSKSLENPSSSKKRCRDRSRSRSRKSRSRSRSNSLGRPLDKYESTTNPTEEKENQLGTGSDQSAPNNGVISLEKESSSVKRHRSGSF